MSDGSKTEKPTHKRLREARKKGQVAHSTEITTGLQIAVMLAYLYLQGSALYNELKALIELSISVLDRPLSEALTTLAVHSAKLFASFIGGVAICVITVTILSSITQVGLLFAGEAVMPKLERINPIDNLKQRFSWKSVFELGKSVVKVAVLGSVMFYLLHQYLPSLGMLSECGTRCGMPVALQLAAWLWAAWIVFFMVLGPLDLLYQRFNFSRQMMMSKHDVKRDHIEEEGNPQIKSKRRAMHRRIQSGSLAANVARSSLVVRNPSHVAVCLYYQAGDTPLPQVIEKGVDEAALHIVRLAERAGVPVVTNVTVARTLLKQTEVGDYIPASMIEPVAQLLRLVKQMEQEAEQAES